MTDENTGPPSEFQVPGELSTGSLIAGYRLEERIGAGGMAVVFRAYDGRLDRHVALKLLAPGLAEDDSFRQRFIRESRAAAAVDDPHIIPVLEAGESNGVLFIAMRYVRGGDVRTLIDQSGRLPPGRVADIVSQVAAALDAAHARALVHRDVKPANMLLETARATGLPDHVYLSDFGLTKTTLGTSLALTGTGDFLGTLEYVAPEQIEGRPLDGRCDEYGLACSAFEMLCGQPPFRREQSISVMYAHLSEPPPAIRGYRPELPAAIEAVLQRALAKAPGDRYASCGEFAAALRQVLLGRPDGRERAATPRPDTQLAMPETSRMPGPTGREPEPWGGSRKDAAPAAPVPGEPDPWRDLWRDSVPHAPAAASDTQLPGQGRPTLTGLTDPARPGGSWSDRSGGQGGPPEPPGGHPGRARPWWRSPAPVGGLCVLALALAAGGFLLAGKGHPAAGASSPGAGASNAATVLTPPGCTTATAPAKALANVASAGLSLPVPFGIVASGSYAYVSGGNAVTVLRADGTTLLPGVVRTISIPGVQKGDAITHNGQYVIAAENNGAVVISTRAALSGDYPIVGSLGSPGGSGAAEVLLSADDKYVFVTLQNTAQLAVFNLQAALTDGFGSAAAFVGDVPLGPSPVGLAAAGDLLFADSESGKLTVLNLSTAETDPAQAVTATVNAGCGPARAIVSADQKVLWVTASASDALLGFSTAKLGTDPGHALVADVPVGESPLGVVFVDGGSRMLVADSNQHNVGGQTSSLAVIDTKSALAGKPALLGYLPTGMVPRQFALEAGGKTLLVTVTSSNELQAINVGDLP
ncbi:MAG: protein kinase [Streptosporangiaceae bacterium]